MDVLGIQQQSEIDTDNSTRRCKGVDLWIVDHDDALQSATHLRVLSQVVHVLFNKVLHQHIFRDGQIGMQLAQKRLANTPLHLR